MICDAISRETIFNGGQTVAILRSRSGGRLHWPHLLHTSCPLTMTPAVLPPTRRRGAAPKSIPHFGQQFQSCCRGLNGVERTELLLLLVVGGFFYIVHFFSFEVECCFDLFAPRERGSESSRCPPPTATPLLPHLLRLDLRRKRGRRRARARSFLPPPPVACKRNTPQLY